MDKLDFLNAGEPAPIDVPAEPVSEPVAVTEPAPTPEPEPQAVATPEPAPEPKPTVPEGYIPLAAVMDDRDKRKEAERRAKELEEKLQQYQQQSQAPDRDLDPEGYQAFQAQQTQNAILSTRLDISEEMAREKHGNEVVDAAKEWALNRFNENPAFQAEVLAQRNPYGYAVQAYQRHQAMNKLGDVSEVEAFLAWKAAQANAGTQPLAPAPAAAPVIEQPAIPTRSIASATNAGGGVSHTPSGPGTAFGSAFGT